MGYDLLSLNGKDEFELATKNGELENLMHQFTDDSNPFEAIKNMDKIFAEIAKKYKYFRWNNFGWPRVLTLAMAYGWEPMRTVNDSENWNGNYLYNAYQIVKKEDALNLAEALKLALNSNDLDADIEKILNKKNPGDSLKNWLIKIFGNDDSICIGGGEYSFNERRIKEKIIAFIKFCQNGAFEIG